MEAVETCIVEKVVSRLNPRSACYDAVRNSLSSCLLSKNVNIEVYKTLILPVVLYGV
jgi:hypothetical protein